MAFEKQAVLLLKAQRRKTRLLEPGAGQANSETRHFQLN